MNSEHLSWLSLAFSAAVAVSRMIIVQFRQALRDRLALEDAPPEQRKSILDGLAAVARAERLRLSSK
jgi:hypothetical protein